MNDIEFETVARRAATTVREEAALIADSRAALATVLSMQREHSDDERSAVIGLATEPERRRSAWIPMLVAAATVAAVSAVILTIRGDTDSLVVTTQPSQPSPTTEVDPATTVPVVPQPSPITTDGTDATPPTSVPAGDPDPYSVEVPDDIGRPLTRTVIAAAEVGAGDQELGVEDCQACEPLRPWAPVVDADGTVYVADVVNGRWRVVRQGESTNIPFTSGEVVAGSPVIAWDGLLYAVVAAELGPTAPRRVVAYDPFTFDEVASYPVGATTDDRLTIDNGQLHLDDVVVTDLYRPPGTPIVGINETADAVTIGLSGILHEFRFPEGWLIDGRDVVPLDDGSVVVRASANVDSDRVDVVVRIWFDGTAAAGTIGGNTSTNGAVQITPVGLVQLEGTNVVRYELPAYTGADPLAGWAVPELGTPDLALVPRLLPQQPVPGVVSAVRREWAGSSGMTGTYSQYWVRSDAANVVDAVVRITTQFAPRPIRDSTDGDAVVPGWSKAYFNEMAAPFEMISAHSPTRAMSVWTMGLDRGEVLAVATSLRAAAGHAGWEPPDLPQPERWTPVHEGWNTAVGSRTLVERTPDGATYLEMSTITGTPDAIETPGLSGVTTLGSIGGRPALLFDHGGGATAVTWTTSDGAVVVLGSYGPLDQLYEIAKSVVPVDQATWEAASIPDAPSHDGCDSIFC